MEGSFDNWTTRQPLQRSGREFTIVKLLPPGVYQVAPPWAPRLSAWALTQQRHFLAFRACQSHCVCQLFHFCHLIQSTL